MSSTHIRWGRDEFRLPPVRTHEPGTATRRQLLGGGLALGALALAGTGAARAQDATPPVGQMTVERTEQVLRQYLDVLVSDGDFGQFFGDDIVVTLEDTGTVITGKETAIQAIDDLHQVAFTARPEIGKMVVGPGTAGLEVVFAGKHTGDFNGIAATNRDVRVPYAVFYTLANDKIIELRIYALVAGLLLQVTAPPAGPSPVA